MNPCSRNQKLIAWFALDALDARRAAKLRDHFTRCKGCHRYWEEISDVAERAASLPSDPNLEASGIFHYKVAARLQTVDSSSVLENLMSWLGRLRLNWRVALPTIAALVIAIIALVAPRHHPSATPSVPSVVQIVPASDDERDLAPTLANYQVIANQSLDKLDELLTSQGNKRLPPVPALSISSLERAQPFY